MGSVDLPPFLRDKQKENIQKQKSGELPPFIKKKEEEGASSVSSVGSPISSDPFSLKGVASSAAQSSARSLLPEVSLNPQSRLEQNDAIIISSLKDKKLSNYVVGETNANDANVLNTLNLNDDKSISAAISVLDKPFRFQRDEKGVTSQPDKELERSKAETSMLLKQRLMFNKSLQEIDDDIKAIQPTIKDAVTKANMSRERGENIPTEKLFGEGVNVDDESADHFAAGLNYLKDANPTKFKNITRALADKGQVADTDFEQVAEVGKLIRQYQGQETSADYMGSSYQSKKAEYARAIGEHLKKQGVKGGEFADVTIKRAATELGLTNQQIIKDLIFEEKLIGYDAIPKSGGIEAFVRGIQTPVAGIKNTLERWFNESDSDTYLKSQAFDVGIGQKVSNEKGEITSELPSDRGNIWYDALEGFGQFIPQVLLTKGIGGVAVKGVGAAIPSAVSTAAQANKLTNILGTIPSVYLQEYGTAYQDALNKTGNPNEARAMGFMNAGAAAGFELFLPDAKIADKAAGIFRANYANDLADLIRKGGDISDLSSKGRNIIGKFVTEVGSITKQEIKEEVATNITDYLTETIFSPETAKERNLGSELLETAKATAVQMIIPALLGGGGGSLNRDFTKNGLHAAAINIDEFKKSLNRALIEDQITEAENNDAIKILETHRRNIHTAPQVNINDKPLTEEQKLEFAFQETNINILNKQAEGIASEVQKEVIENKIKKAQDIQREILATDVSEEREEDTFTVKIEDKTQPTSLFERVQSVLATPKNETETEAKRIEFVKAQTEDVLVPDMLAQSIDAPDGAMERLNGDRELTTDLIASNSVEDIDNAIKTWRDRLNNIDEENSTEEAVADITRKVRSNLSLLQEGKKKKQAAPVTVQPQEDQKVDTPKVLEKGPQAPSQQAPSDESIIDVTGQSEIIPPEGGQPAVTSKTPVQIFSDRVIAGEKMSEADREFYEQNAAEVDSEIGSRNQPVRVSAERMESEQPPKPPISEPPKGSRIFVERPATELSYRGLQVVANEFSLPNVENRDRKTDLELFRDAETKVNDWAAKGEYIKNIEALVQKAERGEILTDEERVILEQHLANISNELRAMTNVKSPEYDAKLGEILRLKNAGERTRGEAGAALRIPTYHARPKNIVDAMVEEMDVNSVTVLTDAQKEKVQKEWDAIEKAKNDFNKYVFEKEAELSAKSAAAKFEEERKATAPIRKPKKSKEEFGTEVDDILKSIKDKWKKAGESDVLTAVPIPYARQLVAIAPDVLKLMKAYAAQAGSKFVDFVDDIHSYLQQDIPEITKEDIIDIARGVYNEKRPTRNELAEKLQDWRTEAKLIDQLIKLEAGEEPTTEKKKIKRNQEIAALREQIKEHDLTKLADAKESLKKRIDKTQKQLDEGDYGPAEKKESVELDKEGKELQDKLIKLQYERQLRLLIQQQKNSSRRDKLIKGAADVLNIPRTLMTIGDFSAVLRQGIIPAISHPGMAIDAAKKMFQAAVSQKEYDRWFFNLQENPRYNIMRESDLAIADNLNHELARREEDFMSSLAEKIPVVGSTIVKGSERAYTMFLNKMRVDLFNQFADSMEARGVTFQNNSEAYKQMADYVNNATGRGSLGYSLNKIAPLLNSLFFSPRLIASRLNMLTYLAQRRFWKKAPKEVRIAYFKDMAKFIGVGMTVLALSSIGGNDDDEVEVDPRSTDFGKIVRGNQRWDIWGGFQPYIRVAAQVLTGSKKTSSGKIKELGPDQPFGQTGVDVLSNFGRSKLAPVPGALLDLISGRNLIGEKIVYDGDAGKKEITIGDYIKEHMLPLTYTGTQEAVKDRGIQAIFTVGIPSAFGVGTQTYQRR